MSFDMKYALVLRFAPDRLLFYSVGKPRWSRNFIVISTWIVTLNGLKGEADRLMN